MKLFNVKLCVECDEMVELSTEACPSCACQQFVNLARFLGVMDRPKRVGKFEMQEVEKS